MRRTRPIVVPGLTSTEPLGVVETHLQGQIPDVMVRVQRLFQFTEIAEREIASAMELANASAQERIRKDGFVAVRPGPLIEAGMDELYVAHCREVLGRLAAGKPTAPGTDAELIWAISVCSLKAPPSRDVSLLAMQLWRRNFPDMPDPWEGFEPGSHDEYAIKEIEADMRRKLSRDRSQL